MEAGKVTKLKVIRESDLGYVLEKGRQEILLHYNDTDGKKCEVGEEVTVFLYVDHKKRIAATLKIPNVTVFQCGFAKVVDIADFGVFVDIGIRKDILLSKDDLPLFEYLWPQVGDVVYGYLVNKNNKGLLFELGTKDDFYQFKKDAPKELVGKKANVRVLKTGKVGVNVMTDEGYLGFIHHTKYKKEPRLGSFVEARVIHVKDNGEINCSLIPQKEIAIKDDTTLILDYLKNHSGKMPLGDASSPDEIRDLLNISKSAFKRAMGKLIKEDKIYQDEDKTLTILR